MQARDRYPLDAANGACIVTGGYEIKPGEKIIDLDLLTDAIPLGRRICLSPQAVRDMVKLMGWKLESVEKAKAYDEMVIDRHNLSAAYDELTEVVRALIDIPALLPALEKAQSVIARREEATKDDIAGWVDTLEPSR